MDNVTQFTYEEILELKKSLNKLKAEGHFFPDECTMRAFHSVISMWATELVILDSNNGELNVLLTKYDGEIKEFKGKWHIPGGYNKWHESDIAETCSRVAHRELGTDVRFIKIIDAYKWTSKEHPYGHPLSLYVLCELILKPVLNENLNFFSVRSLPKDLLPVHKNFLEVLLTTYKTIM